MYRIAVVEDEEQYRDEVCQYIQKYEEEHKLEFLVTTYADGQEIVDDTPHPPSIHDIRNEVHP